MPIGLVSAGVAAAGAIGGAYISSQAANKATKAQQTAFNTTQQEQAPFRATGTSALNQLGSLYGLSATDPATGAVTPGTGTPSVDPNATFYQTPDYQFALSQGIKGVDAGAAARGMLDSGATRKAEIAYGGNLASGQFNNYANRLQALAGIGQNSANVSANVNQNNADNIGNIALANGAAQSNNLNSLLGTLSGGSANKSSYASSIIGSAGSPAYAGGAPSSIPGISTLAMPAFPGSGLIGAFS